MSSVRVFINGKGIDAPANATSVEAVRIADESEATAIMAGQRTITDSRGLPVEREAPVFGGAILRTVSARNVSTN